MFTGRRFQVENVEMPLVSKFGRIFLDHIVTPHGILPNPEKVKAVLRIKPLKNVAEVRAFLGLAGYFRRFIRNFALISRPLERLKTGHTNARKHLKL